VTRSSPPSLIRLLRACPDGRTGPAFIKALSDPSPLVRGAAAAALAGHVTPQSLHPLLAATRDDFRLVRVRAAATLRRRAAGPARGG